MPSMHLSHIHKWILASPPVEWALQHLRELVIGALRQGPIPQHVAFVMDGNRRFARSHQIETVEGHNLGFEALARILEVCYKSGVKVVTIYAFSIENFKRSKYEVDALMEMAKVKLSQLAQHGDLLDRYGASIRILGQRELVKADVLEAMDRAVSLTSHNKQAILNVCFPYTSRDEITTAIRGTVLDYSKPLPSLQRPFSESHITQNIRSRNFKTSALPSLDEKPYQSFPASADSTAPSSDAEEENEDERADGEEGEAEEEEEDSTTTASSTTLSPDTPPSTTAAATTAANTTASNKLAHAPSSDPTYPDPETITPATLNAHMFTAGMPPLDLLVRTSGVERLSDFMLWQCHQDTDLVFLSCLWPEFDLWHFLPVLVEWQWRRKRADEKVSGGGGGAAAAAAGSGKMMAAKLG
ncbi:MAG: hypothetical protein M1819_005532 [Sarea resinae]|nr:MAG: hypothetical protein M1819_005532 [Sarea resinae]